MVQLRETLNRGKFNDERQIVELLRFWNSAREQGTHGL